MATKKPTLKWAESTHSASYVTSPHIEERGRVVPRYKFDGTIFQVIAHVWGPDAGSEATESLTFTPDENNPQSTLIQKARTWVEERVKFLDKEGSTGESRP